MKTILFVLLDQWSDWEAAYVSSAIQLLGQNRYSNQIVSLTKDSVASIGGFRVVPDYTVESVPQDYEALLLIGGLSWRQETALQVKPLVDHCLAAGKVLGGICDASGFLGTLGALNSVRHTGNDLNDLKAWAGQAYTGEDSYVMQMAVSDHNIVTANGTAPLEFAKEILRTLKVASEEKITEWYDFHKLGLYNAPYPKM